MTTTLVKENAAAIADRIGASEEDVQQALADPEAVQQIIRERGLSEDLAVFLIVANAQSRRHRDVIITLPT